MKPCMLATTAVEEFIVATRSAFVASNAIVNSTARIICNLLQVGTNAAVALGSLWLILKGFIFLVPQPLDINGCHHQIILKVH